MDSARPTDRAVVVVPNSKAKSEVWFSWLPSAGDGSGSVLTRAGVICRLCSQDVPYTNNMSNLFFDLEQHHWDEYAKLRKADKADSTSKESQQSSIVDSFAASSHLGESSIRHKQLYCVCTATWNCASTVPARYQHLLGTISSGSVHMTKACQHRAKPSHAVLAQFTSIKWAKSVLHPCHAKHWTSVYQYQKRVTVISRLCSCILCFFCYRWYGKGGNCLLQTSCLLSCHQMGATLLSCSVLASG